MPASIHQLNTHVCVHTHDVQVDMDEIGKFATINWSTVHTSAYPIDLVAVVAQFFFTLSTESATRPKRQRFDDRKAFSEGRLHQPSCECVGRRAVLEWEEQFAHRDAASLGIGKYQGKMLSNTLIWEKGAIESELESEFAELHALTKLAEAKFAEEYGCDVRTHTIWLIKKTGDANGLPAGRTGGGFEPHVDQFRPALGHIGTVSVPIAFLRKES